MHLPLLRSSPPGWWCAWREAGRASATWTVSRSTDTAQPSARPGRSRTLRHPATTSVRGTAGRGRVGGAPSSPAPGVPVPGPALAIAAAPLRAQLAS